jgi:hypothetical protein
MIYPNLIKSLNLGSKDPLRGGHSCDVDKGFALVATLMLLVLLALLAVGLLSLSAVTLRGASNSSDYAVARANARMALMIAMGELQKSMGPDRRISATSDILTTSSAPVAKPNITGVWESWWDFDPSAAPDYTNEKTNRFRRWLVSNADMTAPESKDFVTTAWTGKTIELVGSGALGVGATAAEKVTAGLVPVFQDGKVRGAYGWHVSDESVKARINLYRDPDKNTTLAQKRALLAGHRPDPSVMKGRDGSLLVSLPSDLSQAEFAKASASVGKVISLEQAELLNGSKGRIKQFRNDITPYSLGVMADVRGGGLKQDLSSVFEMGNAAANTLPAEFTNKKLYQATHGITGVSDPNWSALAGYYNSFRRLTAPDTHPTIAVKAGTDFTDPVPAEYSPSPVIAKVDTIFSLVGRPMTDVGWIDKTKYDYFVDIIFTPVVTLHNPYNVNLSFQKMEVTFTNIPVAFNFMLQDGGVGGFVSKSVVPGTFESLNTMYQIPSFRGEKKFVVHIADWADSNPLKVSQVISAPIVMKPGQTMVCGPSLPPNSSFYKDTRSGYGGDAYNWHEDDSKGSGKITEKMKVRPSFVPGIGFETSASMISNTRFGAGMGSWCSYFMLRDQASPKPSPLSRSTVTDRFYVEFKVQKPYYYSEDLSKKTATLQTVEVDSPTFTVTAKLQAAAADSLVDFAKLQFDYKNDTTLKGVFDDRVYRYPPTGSLTPSEAAAPGGVLYNQQGVYVHPFAIFSAYGRTTNGGVYETGKRSKSPIDSPQVNLLKDGRLAGKPYLFHNPSRSNFIMDLAKEKPGIQASEFNFQPFLSKGDLQDYMDVDVNNRVPSLSGNKTTTGVKSGSYFAVPSGPLQTIADFRRSNALTTSYLPQFVQPVGNSLLHPLMSSDKVIETNTSIAPTALLDHSVLANHALFDRFYFSTFATQGATKPDAVFEKFMYGTAPLASQAFQPYLPGGKTVASAKAELFASGTPKDSAYKTAAEYQMIRGPFNVNSTSVQAWKSVLASMNKSDVTILWARTAGLETKKAGGIAISAMSLVNGGSVGTAVVDSSKIDNQKSNDWNGYRELTEAELENLAVKIVAEVRDRGPFLSMSEFVNRQIGPLGPRSLGGALETAIAKAEINEKQGAVFPATYLGQVPITASDVSDPKLYAYKTPEATTGNPAAGAPGWVNQGDLVRILGTSATVRGDTFVIRAYGESHAANGKIVAHAYAEAVVQRVPDYVDQADRPSINAYSDPTVAAANKAFGRRINVVSFRWLSDNEI